MLDRSIVDYSFGNSFAHYGSQNSGWSGLAVFFFLCVTCDVYLSMICEDNKDSIVEEMRFLEILIECVDVFVDIL